MRAFLIFGSSDHIPGEASQEEQGGWDRGSFQLWRRAERGVAARRTLRPGDQRADYTIARPFRYHIHTPTLYIHKTYSTSHNLKRRLCVFFVFLCRSMEGLHKSWLARAGGVPADTKGRPHHCSQHLVGCLCQEHRVGLSPSLIIDSFSSCIKDDSWFTLNLIDAQILTIKNYIP